MWSLLAAVVLGAPAQAGEPVTWVGIDYTYARMIGTGDFNEPDAIFPGYLDKWNQLWIEEIVPELVSTLRAEVTVDDDAVMARNQTATSRQIERRDAGQSVLTETTITTDLLSASVRGYALRATSGDALVLVVDRYVKLQEQGCAWVVWFDAGTRQLRAANRYCKEASGFGFRNYWFHPLKELLPEIKRTRPD